MLYGNVQESVQIVWYGVLKRKWKSSGSLVDIYIVIVRCGLDSVIL